MPFKHKLARRLAINDRQPARPRPWLPAAMALALGCTGVPVTDPAVSPIVSIALTPTNPTVFLGDSIEFQVVGITVAGDTQAVGMPIEWTASAGAITAKGNGKGQYKPRGGGRFRVTAQVDTLADSTIVTVVDTVPASVEVTPASASVRAGASLQLAATVRDAAGNVMSGASVTWTSGTPARATVSAAGLVTGLDTGAVVITATSRERTGTASLAVTAPPSTGALAFYSDWSTATGNSVNAVSDGGRWNGSSGDNAAATALEVVPGTSVRGDTWTGTPNVLAIYMRGPNHDYVISKVDAVPQSTTHWGRCYLMFEAGVSHQRNMHPFAYDPVGSIDLVQLSWGGGTAPWISAVADVDYRIGNRGAGFASLTRGRWYRYEWMVEYVTSTSVRIWPRLYDMAGTLLYDAGGFLHEDNINYTLADFQANNARSVNAAEAREIGLGQPGPAGTTDTGAATYVAACGVSIEGWVGGLN